MGRNFLTLTSSSSIRDTFVVVVDGDRVNTTVTHASSVVDSWLSSIQYFHRHRFNTLVVGLGVQWKPHSGNGVYNPAATLQLCVGRRCLIFQIIHADRIPDSLRSFLARPNYTFVGIWNHSDARMLSANYGLNVRTVDLRFVVASYVGNPSLQLASREILAAEILNRGIQMPYWVGRSEWDAWNLTDEQVEYACVDAYLSFMIGKAFGASGCNSVEEVGYGYSDDDGSSM